MPRKQNYDFEERNWKTDKGADSCPPRYIMDTVLYHEVGSSAQYRIYKYWQYARGLTLEVGCNCYSDDTEILTENGWKLFKDLQPNEKVATLYKGEYLEYQLPTNYITKYYNGKMFNQKGQQIDLLVNPNHNLYVKRLGSKKYELIEAQRTNIHLYYKRNMKWIGQEQEYFILPSYTNKWISNNGQRIYIKPELKIKMDDWLEFLGYWITEGSHYKSKKGYKIDIAQKDLYVKNKIELCLKRIGFHNNYEGGRFVIWNVQLYNYLIQFGLAHEKFINRELFQLSSRQIKILFDAMMLGDGDKIEFRKYFTSSKQLADDFSEIIIKIGLAANIMKDNRIQNNKQHLRFIVGISRKHLNPEPNNHIDKRKYIDYSGKIYCVKVPNHIIYVRRNGKACWCGNCGGVAMTVANKTDLIIGVDFMRYALKKANTNMKQLNAGIFKEEDNWCHKPDWKMNCGWTCASGIAIPFKDESFDTVLFPEIIEHLPRLDRPLMIAEGYRLMKKDGVFLFSTPTDVYDPDRPNWMKDIYDHVHPFGLETKESASKMITDAGFKILEVENDFHDKIKVLFIRAEK